MPPAGGDVGGGGAVPPAGGEVDGEAAPPAGGEVGGEAAPPAGGVKVAEARGSTAPVSGDGCVRVTGVSGVFAASGTVDDDSGETAAPAEAGAGRDTG